MNQKYCFKSYFSQQCTQFWDNTKIDKTQKYIMEDLYYIQTPLETMPCNLRMNKKNLIMEQDDRQYSTNVENAGLELITSDFNNDQGVRITKGNYTFEFFGKIKSIFDQLKRTSIQFNFTQRYTIKKMIAKGTFATIYLAECKFTQNEYAVKCFEKRQISNEKDKKNLIKEMQILRLMNHNQLLTIYEVFENSSYIYFIQELLKGGDLHEYLERSEKLSEVKVSQIIYNLLNGVQYMHSQGVLHRDIKPENLILRQKNNLNDIVIGDFGLADIYKYDGNYLYRRCGTPGYVAPEILRGQPYDYKVDIYSIGVLLYILLSGRRPFVGKNNQQTIKLNEMGDINYDDIECSSEAMSLMKKMLESQPENRISILSAKQHPFITNNVQKRESQRTKNTLKLDMKCLAQQECVSVSPILTSRPLNRHPLMNNFTIHTPRQLPRLSHDVKAIAKTESNDVHRTTISRQSMSRANLRLNNQFTNLQVFL
ncbi:unnamed protein product (macronuclear) [Paramecium tetraurelia]|uniref:Protein kinase domain-containing protein n=1 Tax=Paramecium tetraurelia TaxID=5888 RepID=A0DZW9_PARTE|nr:uncharacterized protein GSPATT00021754001 [Paramecium tetraurelia]CAK88586.1 unnamed protein product [Paramecium tetraurelia]|eukprot:XP_001455983.1 hypothetical protein (macronuclear) [Paramecium tetraurelia strain d4-2]